MLTTFALVVPAFAVIALGHWRRPVQEPPALTCATLDAIAVAHFDKPRAKFADGRPPVTLRLVFAVSQHIGQQCGQLDEIACRHAVASHLLGTHSYAAR